MIMSDIEKYSINPPRQSTSSPTLEQSELGHDTYRNRDSITTYASHVPLNLKLDSEFSDRNASDHSEARDRVSNVDSGHDVERGPRAKAYLTILGAFLALFCTFGQINAFGSFQTWYATHQLEQFSPSTISWIGSLQLWVFFVSGGPIGYLFDLYGPRWLMLVGMICYVFSIMMTSISTQYYQYILSQGILFGIGVGLLFYPSLSCISTHFNKYRATALGIAMAGSGLGGLVFPIMLQSLFDRIGFGWTVRVSGLICFLLCGIAVFTVNVNDAASGLLGTSRRTGREGGEPSQLAKRSCGGLVEIFKDSRFVLLCIGGSFVALGCFIPYFYIADYAQFTLSLTPHTSFLVLAAMNGGSIPGRILPPILSDTIGRFNLLFPASLLSSILILACWLNTKTFTSIMVFSVLYGFLSGAFISAVTPCVAQISDIKEIGKRIGLLYSAISFPALVGGPVAGALLVLDNGSYRAMIIFSGTTVLVGSLFIFATKMLIDPRIFARV